MSLGDNPAQETVDSAQKLKTLLRKLFQFDESELNFGIYRIMAYKKKAISQFIENDLISEVKKQFVQVFAQDQERRLIILSKIKDEIISAIGNVFDNDNIDNQYINTPIVQKYLKAKQELDSVDLKNEQLEYVFNSIYDFFSRYFDEGDFISKRRYGNKNSYVIPYNGEEVILTWNNHDQFYVKTTEYFNDYSFNLSDWKITFFLVNKRVENDTNSNDKRYFIPIHREDIEKKKNDLKFYFDYRPLNIQEKNKFVSSKNIQQDFINEIVKSIETSNYKIKDSLLKKEGSNNITLIETHLKRYMKRNISDYFVHKNLNSFLNHELDFYLQNEIVDFDRLFATQSNYTFNLLQAKVIKLTCQKIISFISQIENFQKRLFEKIKFVLKTDYCITLDKVPSNFYDEILENKDQINAWKSLFLIDELNNGRLFTKNGKLTVDFLRAHNYLVLDTKFFSNEFKDRLINSFENFENQIGGILIKSENYQALRLLLKKYKDKIKCMYIDPPYNTGNDEFIYKDNYQHSSWLTMMSDRLALAKQLLANDGVIYVSIDDKEIANLRTLLDYLFPENRLSTLIWDLGTGTTAGHFTRSHEYILTYAKNRNSLSNFDDPEGGIIRHGALKKISKANPASEIEFPAGMDFEGNDAEFTGTIGTSEQQLIKGKMIFKDKKLRYPVKITAGWAMKDQILSWIEGLKTGAITYDSKGQRVIRFFFNSQGILFYEKVREKINPKTVISDKGSTRDGSSSLASIVPDVYVQFPKPPQLIQYLISLCTKKDDIIMDFFAGSGTTAQAILTQNSMDGGNRKYILVEMGDYFEGILMKRIQRLMYSKVWNDGKPASPIGISHILKYHYVEQYEDSLNNISFIGLDRTIEETLYNFPDYFVKYMLEYETSNSGTLSISEFKNPFNYNLNIGIGSKHEKIDLVETFNYILGINVVSNTTLLDPQTGNSYKVILGNGTNGETIRIIWRNTESIDLTKDRDFINKNILNGQKSDRLFLNGESLIEGGESIEIEFKKYMEV